MQVTLCSITVFSDIEGITFITSLDFIILSERVIERKGSGNLLSSYVVLSVFRT